MGSNGALEQMILLGSGQKTRAFFMCYVQERGQDWPKFSSPKFSHSREKLRLPDALRGKPTHWVPLSPTCESISQGGEGVKHYT